MRPETRAFDAVIVGGGPSGLAAATELRRLGVGSVAIVEREPVAGGIPRHCGHPPFGMREFGRVLRGPTYAARLVERAETTGVVILTGTTVVGLAPGPRVVVTSSAGVGEITARRVLLCTGVREASRAARLIGGAKPGGILSTGALQSMVYLKGIRPFSRPVILGTELVSFSALLTCRHIGIRPVAMVEPGARTTARWPAALLPRALGIPLHLDTDLVAIHGDGRVTAVTLRDAGGAERSLATDGVVVSGRFLPEASLVRASHIALDPLTGGPVVDQFGRCSDPDFFATGNLLRAVETAGWSWAEGRRTARAIAASLSGTLAAPSTQAAVSVEGPLKYVVPQRVVAGAIATGAAEDFQLRVTRAVRGRLTLHAGDRVIWSKPIDALPERRVRAPLPGAGDLTGSLRFSIAEAAS